MSRWLDDEELRAWQLLLQTNGRLLHRLDAELQAEQGLTLGDYEVLVMLFDERDGLRMSSLAERMVLSRSGLTRRVDGLMRDGLVERRACPSDRRGTMAVITAAGRARLRRAAPTHVRGVRQHFIDRLDRAGLRQLTALLEQVLLTDCDPPAAS